MKRNITTHSVFCLMAVLFLTGCTMPAKDKSSSYAQIYDSYFEGVPFEMERIREISEKGGGKVVIPAGIWKTGPVQLLDNVNLHADANALVIFETDPALYPIIETSFEGLNTRRSTSPIHARGVRNIAITGAGVFIPYRVRTLSWPG